MPFVAVAWSFSDNRAAWISSLGRGDKIDDLVFLQLLYETGEFTLRNSGHRDANLVKAAGHRSGRNRKLVGFEEFGDVVRRRLRREPDQSEGTCAGVGRRS